MYWTGQLAAGEFIPLLTRAAGAVARNFHSARRDAPTEIDEDDEMGDAGMNLRPRVLCGGGKGAAGEVR
jgi:hypothetical protein